MSFTLPAFAPEESQSWRTHCNMDSKCSSSLLSSSSWASFHSAAGWSSHRDLKQTNSIKRHPQMQFPNIPTDGANEKAVVGGSWCMQSAAVSACERSRNSLMALPTDTLHYTLHSQYRLPHFKGQFCLNCEHENILLMWWRGLVLCIPDKPPTSIFFRFLASRIQMVSLPAVGT